MNNTGGRKMWRWVVAVVLVLLVAGGAAAYYFLNQDEASSDDTKNEPLASMTVCSDELVQRAAEAINADDNYQLSSVVGEVVELDQYQSDVNCVYTVLMSDLMSNFADEETKELADRYRTYYEQGVFIASVFNTTTPPSDIDDNIAAIETVEAGYDLYGRDETNTGDSIVDEPGVFVEDAGDE